MSRPADIDPPSLAFIVLPTRQDRGLAAPAQPEHAPALDARELRTRRLTDAQQLGLGLVVVADGIKPALDQGLLLGRIGGEPAELRVSALEQVRQDDDGVIAQQLRQAVYALKCLRREAKGVVQEDEAALGGGASGCGGFGNVWFRESLISC